VVIAVPAASIVNIANMVLRINLSPCEGLALLANEIACETFRNPL
jgi:hypothetical protein